MLGINYNKIADSSCSTTALRARRDEWIRLGIFTHLEATARDGYDKMVGPYLEHLLIDGCIVKASCGVRLLDVPRRVEGNRAPNAPCSPTAQGPWRGSRPAKQHAFPLLRSTLECLSRLDLGLGAGLPETITSHPSPPGGVRLSWRDQSAQGLTGDRETLAS